MTASTAAAASTPGFQVTRRYWDRNYHPDRAAVEDGVASMLVLDPRTGATCLWPVEIVEGGELDYSRLRRGDEPGWWNLVASLRTNDPCRIPWEIACYLLEQVEVTWRGGSRFVVAQPGSYPVLIDLSTDPAVAQQLPRGMVEARIGAALPPDYRRGSDMLHLPPPAADPPALPHSLADTFELPAGKLKRADVLYLGGDWDPVRVLFVAVRDDTVFLEMLRGRAQLLTGVRDPADPVRVRRCVQVPGVGPVPGKPAGRFAAGDWMLRDHGALREVLACEATGETTVTLRLRAPDGRPDTMRLHRDSTVAIGRSPSAPDGEGASTSASG